MSIRRIITVCLVLVLISPVVFANDEIIGAEGTIAPKRNGFFEFFHKKKKKAKEVLNIKEKGYEGTLPDIEGAFEYKKETIKNPDGRYTQKDAGEGLLLDAPLDDPLFLDVIIKKDKSSNYVDDLVKIKETLEKLRKCILDNSSIQFFNANVNILDLQTKNLEKLYSSSAYSQSNSYYAVRHVNYSAKVLGNLKYDANFYSRYMPLQDSLYTPQNIKAQSQVLLDEIERTIYEIGNAK